MALYGDAHFQIKKFMLLIVISVGGREDVAAPVCETEALKLEDISGDFQSLQTSLLPNSPMS